ncbi:MAG: hypothetical protein K1X38_15780 [Microthrixaceae bacterium]|nr:hypothetical protein [Microthrixaceae bacterium]
MNRPSHLATTAALLALSVVSGCGSTRFVVVQNQPAGAPGASAPATTTVPTGPSSAEDVAAVTKLVGDALSTDPDVSFADRLPFLDDAEDLKATADAVQELVSTIEVDVSVDDVVVSGDDATATVSVTSGGEPFASGIPVAVKRISGEWKITRDGACAVLSLGSPCPER